MNGGAAGGQGRRAERTLGTSCVNHISVYYSAAASVPSALLTPWHVNYFGNFPPARATCDRSSVVSTLLPLLFLSGKRPPLMRRKKIAMSASETSLSFDCFSFLLFKFWLKREGSWNSIFSIKILLCHAE